jgi:hypothetical protein
LKRENVLVAVLLGFGFASFTVAFLVRHKQRELMSDRPEGSGDVGSVAVYAQLHAGPVKLQVGRKRVLERPQHVAFQFTAEGTGPREVRIEIVEPEGRSTLMNETVLDAPKQDYTLDYVLDLGDDIPDVLTLVVGIDAPHARGYASSYPMVLTGSEKYEAPRTSTRAR